VYKEKEKMTPFFAYRSSGKFYYWFLF